MLNSFDPDRQNWNQDRHNNASNAKNILFVVLAGVLGISIIAFALIYTSDRRDHAAAVSSSQTGGRNLPEAAGFEAEKPFSENKVAEREATADKKKGSISADTEKTGSPSADTDPGTLDIYKEMDGLIYIFTSGAGAWDTEMFVLPDGSFSGHFHDSNMGENSETYRNGTIYECSFTGKFSPAKKIDAVSYSSSVVELNYETTRNGSDRYIDDDTLHILTEPYGLALNDEIIFYTAGKKVSEIPEDFMSWLHWSIPEGAEELDKAVICDLNWDTAFYPSVYEPEPAAAAETLPVQPEPAVTAAASGNYILPESSSRYLTDRDLDPLSKEELRIARNEIYARRGRRFADPGLQAYFDSQAWYHGTIIPDDFKESLFNDYEKKNTEYISAYEKRKGYD